ncbi:cystathionine beta-lyase [Rhodospirillaceae bacterium SYSU D60014]|uniref:cystathionine beta-lyase n=1 Tax=Virgifigura deserti TaxID=2268457 RepID=UPI000E6661FE
MTDDSLDDTLIGHAGCRPQDNHGIINPPVYHASTVLFPSVAALEEAVRDRFDRVYYGRYGTPTTFALEEAVAALEQGDRAIALPSGLAAIAATLTALLKAGDHLLMVDSVYEPVRTLCNRTLARFGVTTTYYDPLIGAGVADLIRPETRLVYLESPGSLTFEVQDIPAIAAAAHAAGALVAMDNTWATPLFFKPFRHGVDISIHAATKYIVGHSDAMLGLVVTKDPHYRTIKASAQAMGYCAAPDDCYLALRGLRTLSVRLQRHQETGLALARWLRQRPEVAQVLHPGLPDDPGHALWRRDFSGATGLFSIVLNPVSKAALAAMLDGMTLFGMGFSWGGFESLILPVKPEAVRTATSWSAPGPTLRLHAGLEDPQDLITDLERGFDRLRAAS